MSVAVVPLGVLAALYLASTPRRCSCASCASRSTTWPAFPSIVFGAFGLGFFDAQVGVSLPHNAAAQYGYGAPVSQGDLQPGDLVFFDGLGHVGLYIGGGQFIHAPHTGDVVKISSLSGWYAATYVGARRL